MLAPILTLYSQDGTSEEFIGEWAEARGIRDQLFIGTKVRVQVLLNEVANVDELSLSTLSTTRLTMNLSLKKYSMLGIVRNLCTSPWSNL